MKLTLQQNAVDEVDELRRVKQTAELDRIKTGTTLSYEKYTTLLLSACTTFDTAKGFKPRVDRSRIRAVYTHELEMEQDNMYSSFEETYDLDTPVDVIEAYAAKQTFKRAYKPRLARDQWYALSPEDQSAWDKISDKGKTTILNKATTNQIPGNAPLRSIQKHAQEMGSDGDVNLGQNNEDSQDTDIFHDTIAEHDQNEVQDDDNVLLAHATDRHKQVHPASMARFLSKSSNMKGKSKDKPATTFAAHNNEITLDGKRYRQVNMTNVTYSVSTRQRNQQGALVDCGANGGVAGEDMRVIEYHDEGKVVDISGVDNHRVNNVRLATCGGVTTSQYGEVIVIGHQYARTGKGHSIHSSAQIEWFKNMVDDKSTKVGGRKCIVTNDGYALPLDIINGLPYLPMRPYTDHEWETLPHVVLTSDVDWDPTVLDNITSDTDYMV